MADDAEDRSSDPAADRAEPRASAGAREAESGSTSEDDPTPADDFERLWQSLSDSQKKVAQQYLFVPTKAEAAEAVGLAPSTVYSWPDKVWEAASRLVDERKDGLSNGLSALTPSALDVLRRALDPDEDVSRVESETAQYLVNQLEGKPTQKQIQEHQGGIDLDPGDEDAIDDALSHLD